MGDADFDFEQHEDMVRGEQEKGEAILFQDLAKRLDATYWAKQFLKVWNEMFGEDAEPVRDVKFEMESLMTTWFANAIEAGRDAGPATSRGPETLAHRAMKALNEAATALQELPSEFRSVMPVFNVPLNRPDHMREEASDIERRVQAASEALREV